MSLKPQLLGAFIVFAAGAACLNACGGATDAGLDEEGSSAEVGGGGTGATGAGGGNSSEPGTADDAGAGTEPDPGNAPPGCSGVSALCVEGTYWSVEACACVPETPQTDPEPVPPPSDCSGISALCIEGMYWSVEACACVAGTPCGPTVCVEGQVCCNASCGICTPPDGACIELACEPVDPPPPDPEPIDPPPPDCSGISALCIEGTYWSVEKCACVPATPCGPTYCIDGDVCCNESCGICTPPDGACTQQFCGDPLPGGECTTDKDCTLVEDYCGGCNCLALPNGADAPTCSEPVYCFVAACFNKVAACIDGTCTAVDQ